MIEELLSLLYNSIMNKEQIDKINSRCVEIYHFWNENAWMFLDWANKKRINKMLETKYKKMKNKLGEMPDHWHEITKERFAFEKIFGNSVNIRKLLKTIKDELSDSEIDLLKSFEKTPWQHALFTVKERISDHLFLVHDYLKDQEYVLWSNFIAEMKDDEVLTGAEVYFGSVFNNGRCFQHLIYMDSYTRFVPEDFFSFAKLMYHKNYEKQGMRTIIKNNLTDFYFLYYIQALMMEESPEILDVCYASTFNMDKPDSDLTAPFETHTVDDYEGWKIFPDDTADKDKRAPNVIYDNNSGSLNLIADSREEYDFVVKTLGLSKEQGQPQYVFSWYLTEVLSDLWEKEIPAFEARESFVIVKAEKRLKELTSENEL